MAIRMTEQQARADIAAKLRAMADRIVLGSEGDAVDYTEGVDYEETGTPVRRGKRRKLRERLTVTISWGTQ